MILERVSIVKCSHKPSHSKTKVTKQWQSKCYEETWGDTSPLSLRVRSRGVLGAVERRI